MQINIRGNAAATLSVSGTAAQTAALTGGLYDVWCTVDVYVKTAGTANDVTTANGYLIRVGETLPAMVVQNGDKIGAIAGSAGTLSYHKVL